MGYAHNVREGLDAKWRTSEFVVSYPQKGSYPTGTLHRSTCRTLSVESRIVAAVPASVHSIELERFRQDADASHIGNSYRVCQICCADIEVKGRRMEAPKPPKKLRVVLSLTKEERSFALEVLGDIRLAFFQAKQQAALDKLVAALKAARVEK